VLAIATWPLYRRIHGSLGGRATWSAALMMLLILVLVVIPIAFLSAAAGGAAAGCSRRSRDGSPTASTCPKS